MTISSSMNAGVAGLNANATRLATISDNIANSATYGYRRAETDFTALVLQGSDSSRYSAGGVRTSTSRAIDENGPLINTSNATDLAVDGRGMIPVTTAAAASAADGSYPLRLMTTASFKADEQGILTTSSGMVLLGWPANADGTIDTYSRVSASGLQPVRVNWNQFVANPTTEAAVKVNLPATSTKAGATGSGESLALEYFDTLGTSQTLDISFEPSVPASGSSNEWTMTIRDSASSDSIVGQYRLTFSDAAGSGGTLQSVATVSGGTYNPTTGKASVAVAGGNIALDIGTYGAIDGMTQLSGTFAPVTLTHNGSTVASVTSVEIDEKGYVNAICDQGFTRRIYQIPLVDVANVNGLKAGSNQTYEVTPDSGAIFLWDAGDGPTGTIQGYSREESTTDVANELTQLIRTQRAYSSNAKVIQTADEMLQEASSLKR
ncbi:flagellar hook-basal body complex protein [Tabrizicola sp. J26]|uniref:flagellar hook protein FlgE n=1 Tax=Alitabrizicola rongguiensis TaxID=2909234 RepID=UPI001F352643|nr:flagellar hook-basal body complex protein [Tabrizicola rongguiensis]MCF1710620.1 flagellar hook-basal body complex protein [Tabrizicola rongguiensis]